MESQDWRWAPSYPYCDDTCTTDCGHCKGDHEKARVGQAKARAAREKR